VFDPLRHRDFRLLWVGQTLSMIGSFVSNVAFPFQLLQLGGSALELGTLVSIFGSALLVFLLVGGAVADRVPRRTLLVVTEVAEGVVMAIIAALGVMGVLQIWHLYLAMAVFGITSAFSGPALSALIPELVPADILVSGNALRGLSRQAARSIGPVLGGLLVGFAGPPTAFAVDAISFFVSAAAVALTLSRPLARLEPTSIVADIREGLAFVFSVQWLWVTIFGWSLINAAFVGAYVVGLPLLVTETLREGAFVYGIITASMGIGEAVGATVIAQVRVKRTGLVMFLFGALSGVAQLAYGLIPTLWGALLGGVLLGISFVCFGVLWESALQRHVPRRLLGRVSSVDWFGGSLLGPIAPIVAAALVVQVAPTGLFVIAGATTVVLTLLGLLLPSIRDLE
jgi:DHA3 family tetracycline resistance protein-like MFS transporter